MQRDVEKELLHTHNTESDTKEPLHRNEYDISPSHCSFFMLSKFSSSFFQTFSSSYNNHFLLSSLLHVAFALSSCENCFAEIFSSFAAKTTTQKHLFYASHGESVNAFPLPDILSFLPIIEAVLNYCLTKIRHSQPLFIHGSSRFL